MFFLTFFLAFGAIFGMSKISGFGGLSRYINTSNTSHGDTSTAAPVTSWDGDPNTDYEYPNFDLETYSGKTVIGTSASENLKSGTGDDVLVGNGGRDVLVSGRGDDYLEALNATGLTGLYGQSGDDIFVSSVPKTGQIHIGAGDGNDHLYLDLTNYHGNQGHHVYTGRGDDRIEFTNIDEGSCQVIGRIDDFDASRDTIWIEGQEMDLNNLPDGVDVVEYLGQQYLRIEDKALYALEGAAEGGDTPHFNELPDDMMTLKVVDFVDQQNFVPKDVFDAEDADLNEIKATGQIVTGTAGDDWIFDEENNGYEEPMNHANMGEMDVSEMTQNKWANKVIDGGDGNDVIDAGKGDDTVYGGNGDDYIAGGMDDDYLKGGNGNDYIWGGSENDTLKGSAGDDHLYGGEGNDTLIGGDGQDYLTGGGGNDTFHIADNDLAFWDDLEGTDSEKLAQLDIITDFTIGEDKLTFDEELGVESVTDLSITKTEMNGEALFRVEIIETGQSFLVNSDDENGDDESQGDFMGAMGF